MMPVPCYPEIVPYNNPNPIATNTNLIRQRRPDMRGKWPGNILSRAVILSTVMGCFGNIKEFRQLRKS